MSIREQHVGVLVAGVGCIIALMLVLLYVALSHDTKLREAQHNIQIFHEKTRLAYIMREAIHKRGSSLAAATKMEDFFERDAEQQRFYAAAREFISAREKLLSLGIGPLERSILLDFQSEVRKGRPFVEEAMSALVEGLPIKEADDLAIEAISIQTTQFGSLDKFVDAIEKLESDQFDNIRRESEEKRKLLILIGSLVFFSGAVIAILIIVRERHHLFSLQTEISDRKKAENYVRKLNTSLEMRVDERTTELNKSRDALLEAQKVAAIGSWEWLIPENKIIWSQETFHLFGMDPGLSEPNFEEFIERVHPDDRDMVKDAVDAALKKDTPYNVQFRIPRTNGSLLDAQAIGKVETDAGGRPIRMYGTFQDITAQKEAEETLRKLSRAVEQSPSSVFITNTDGIIEYVNSRFTEMMGYTLEEAVGQTPRIIQSSETPKELYTELWETILAGREWRGEIMDKHKSGVKFWSYATIAPVKDNMGMITHYVAMHENITQRKEAEAGMSKALEEAGVANRSKSELLANMSHELRTPLNAIIGFSDTMRAETYGPLGHQKYSEYLDDISSSGQHLLELINDILDVSAIEAGKVELIKENLDIGEIIAASIRLVKGRFKEDNVRLLVDIDDDLPHILADKRRLKQILINLLSNAGKFTKSGGTVTISASQDNHNGYQLTVADTGIGMGKAELSKAMSQFGQVDRGKTSKHEGAGLGLPLTKMLVELHGGTLEIESKKGIGTTMMLHFPTELTAQNS